MNKKGNAIMIADTRPALIGNLLVQLKETNPNLFDVALIYYNNISEDDKKIMQDIMPCEFIKFTYKLPKNVRDIPSFKKFSSLMFARYYMFDFLNEYKTVTWVDTDVLICGDISSIITKANKTGMSANFEDPANKSYLFTDTISTSFNEPIAGYDMNKYNMSSGLITVSNSLKDYDKMTKWCFDKTIELANSLILPDQGILNLLVQEFDIKVSSVGENGAYCFYPTYKRDSSKAKIIHAWGARKFWKSWYLYKKFPKWGEYYNKWVELGGSDYFGTISPDVSIVIPTYNTNVKYFDLVLNDLLVRQVQDSNFQYDNFEVIVVIDGEISQELNDLFKSYDDPRLVIIHNEERFGIAKSLNVGIKAAKGKYIARIDDDDRVNFSRLYKQVKYLDTHLNIDLVSSYFEYFGDLNEARVTLSDKLCHAWSLFSCPFDHPTIMFRKKFFLDNNLYYDESRSHVEDWELWLRCFEKGLKVEVIPEILYYHRWYNGQAGQNIKTVNMMYDLVKKNFEKLNVFLSSEELVYVSPWQGKVDAYKLKRLEEIFSLALDNNKKLKIYDQSALETVFSFRLIEARTGVLSPLIINKEELLDFERKDLVKKVSLYYRLKNKVLRPIYKPFRRVFYNITAEAVNNNISLINAKIKDCLNNIEIISSNLNDYEKKLANINKKLNNISNNNLLHDQIYDFHQEFNLLFDKDINDLYFKKKIVLIGTSEHGNMGDAAFTMGTREFIRKYFADYIFIEVSTYDFSSKLSYLQKIINNDDIIFLQGGGNIGNRYINEENIRRNVIDKFPNNKIFILPQTIYFDKNGTKELEISKSIYNKHNNLNIFVRGETSLKYAKQYFGNSNHYLSIDCALILNYDYNYNRNGILCCIRDLDDESGLTKNEYDKIFEIVKKIDKNYYFTTNTSKELKEKMNLNHEVYNQLENFAKHKLVITDRLHGMIFALITNTPCIVLSSYNNKIAENYDMLKDNKMITFIDKDIDKLEESIKKYLNMDISNYKNDYSSKFENMATIIKGNNEK